MPSMRSESAHTPSELQSTESAGLRWTGHPLVDHGVATLVAFADRKSPHAVSIADLEAFASYAEVPLASGQLGSVTYLLFTSNPPYGNPSPKITPQQRRERARGLLTAFKANIKTDEQCTYCGRSATKLHTETGRAYREIVPLITAQHQINFGTFGRHGHAICGLCLLALLAITFSVPICEGHALVVASDNAEVLPELVRPWLARRRMALTLTDSGQKLQERSVAPRTRLIEHLIELDQQGERAEQPHGLSLLCIRNETRTPYIRLYQLPALAVSFFRKTRSPLYRSQWAYIERRGWQARGRHGWVDQGRAPLEAERLTWRNMLYEQLFTLPQGAGSFVRLRLRAAQLASILGDSISSDDRPPLWALTTLFMWEVMGMDNERIEAIRDLGDTLATEILDHDHRIFRSAVRLRHYGGVRRLLIQVGARRLKRGDPPTVTLRTFQLVFDEVFEIAQADWRLAWDLILIRLMEKLHEHKSRLSEVTADMELDDIEDLSTAEQI